MQQKYYRLFLSALFACLAITNVAMAQVKTASTILSKASVYTDPARCKKRFDGTADLVPELLKCLYEPYTDPNPDYKNNLASVDVIRNFASSELRKLIDALRSCELREQGICGPDHNYLIAGQDWAPLQGFTLQFDKTTRRANIKFTNGERLIRVTFIFGIEHRRWVFRDIINDQIDPDDGYGPDSYFYALNKLK